MPCRNILPIDLLRQLLHYDPLTGSLTWKRRGREHFGNDRSWKTWNTRFAGRAALTTKNPKGYFYGTICGRTFTAARVAFALHNGRWPTMQVDHEDRDRGNNRARNLRDVSPWGNAVNRNMYSNNTTGVTGVYWAERDKVWYARIDQTHLGSFKSKAEAMQARQDAERQKNYHPTHGVTA